MIYYSKSIGSDTTGKFSLKFQINPWKTPEILVKAGAGAIKDAIVNEIITSPAGKVVNPSSPLLSK